MPTIPTKLYLYAIAVLLVIGGLGGTYFYVGHLKSELALAVSQNAVLTVTVASQQSAINECNSNTEKLKEDSKALAQKAQAAQELAEKEAKGNYDKSKTILKLKQDPKKTDTQAANDLLNSLIP